MGRRATRVTQLREQPRWREAQRAGARRPYRSAALAAAVLVLAALAYILKSGGHAATVVATEAPPDVGSTEPARRVEHGNSVSQHVEVDTLGARAIAGTVRGSNQSSIAGAMVCIVDPGRGCCALTACVRSDAGGAFNLGEVRAKSVFASASGYASRQVQLAEGPELTPVSIRLEPVSQSSVEGRVMDAAGGPVSGALITAMGGDDPNALPLGLAQSDAAGQFRIEVPVGGTRLVARTEAYSEASRWVHAPVAGVRLVMAPASDIRGRVVEQDTDELVSQVRVDAMGENGILFSPLSTETALDGSFHFAGLPAGGYSLSVTTAQWRAERHWVVVGVGQTAEEVRLEVKRAVALAGSVQVNGVPCKAGAIEMLGPVNVSVPLRDGRAQIDGLLPGTYELAVFCDGAAPLSERLEVGTTAVVRDWELEAGLTVRGRAERADGRPFTGATVSVSPIAEAAEDDSSLRRAASCTTDARGQFTCGGLLPGAYECSLQNSLQEGSPVVPVSLAVGSEPQVVLRAHAAASIRATLQKVASSSIGEPAVFARRDGLNWAMHSEPDGESHVFKDLPLGQYTVYAGQADPGANPGSLVRLERDGQVVEVSLEAAPTPTAGISGRVIDDEGLPVVDAWLRAETADTFGAPTESAEPVLSNGEGEFAIEGLAEGTYTLYATTTRGEGSLARVRSGAQNAAVTVQTFGTIVGTLQSPEGAPAPDGRVIATHEGGQTLEASVSAGTWSIPWARPGLYELSVASSRGEVTASNLQLRSGGRLEVELQLKAPSDDSANSDDGEEPNPPSATDEGERSERRAARPSEAE